MALNGSRSLVTSYSRALRQCRCPSTAPASLRPLSSSSRRAAESTSADEALDPNRPRWSFTPERMKGPGFSINIVKDPRRKIWSVNEDPKKLDAMYNRLLGPGGDRLLPDEIKWLAVTHKSFDHGRRGYNTKLAYFGRLILAQESTRAIVTGPQPGQTEIHDPYGREPFQHPALSNVDKLNHQQPRNLLTHDKIRQLGVDVGLQDVVRWKPRLPENLEGSGVVAVLNTTVYAIIGAISLQQGAEVAGKIVREKILKRLGS